MRSSAGLAAMCGGMLALCATLGRADGAEADSRKHVLLFSGGDLSSLSAFNWTGAEAGWNSLDRSGPVFRIMGGMGTYAYDKDGAPDGKVAGTVMLGEVLAGWRHIGTAVCVSVLGGFAIEDHDLDVPDPENEVQGSESGAKIAAEVFWRPTQTTQVEASVAYATTFDFWRVRLAGGIATWRDIVVGAETEAFGNTGSDQARLGVFVSNIGWRAYDFKLAAGALHDGEGETGAYGRLGVERKF
jgi:hypothetical protein